MSVTLEQIVSLAKRRGFVYQGSEIYGGLAGTWDLGPLGAELAYNIKDVWWNMFVARREDMYGIRSSLMMPERVWEASGHLEGFSDPMIECKKCKRRFRADHLEDVKKCVVCGGALGEERAMNLMFPIDVGASDGGSARAYLRGENAQGMFVNFKNILDSFHPKLPFGIAQIGTSFRNEIAPRDFLFRVREFELAEFEYFVREEHWEEWFSYWQEKMWEWMRVVGIDESRVHELEVLESDRAHYSKRTVDFEFDFPFGRKELYGLAYRTDHDLAEHMKYSGVDLRYHDAESGERFLPHVVEPTFGIGRTLLAVLVSAYTEDEIGGERRTFLKLPERIAPVRAAVFPLLRNKPELVARAREIYAEIKHIIPRIMFDDNGNIGKRYRRQDEIGTPKCVTVDFETLENDTVTIRERDSGKQERVPAKELTNRILGSKT